LAASSALLFNSFNTAADGLIQPGGTFDPFADEALPSRRLYL
jgi:hypothetical protein